MSNLYRRTSIDASYQVLVYLAKIFKNRPIRNNNGLWWPCLLMDRDKIFLAVFGEDLPRMLPTKFRFIWPSGFRGDDFLEINQLETELPVVAMFVK